MEDAPAVARDVFSSECYVKNRRAAPAAGSSACIPDSRIPFASSILSTHFKVENPALVFMFREREKEKKKKRKREEKGRKGEKKKRKRKEEEKEKKKREKKGREIERRARFRAFDERNFVHNMRIICTGLIRAYLLLGKTVVRAL